MIKRQSDTETRLFVSLIAALVLLCSYASATFAQPAAQARITSSFDNDWRFLKGDAPGAERRDFDDTSWRLLDVPHDWSIEGPVDEKNPTGQGGGFMPSGVSWYRKHFTLSKDLQNRLVFIEFGGVMANSDVWINDVHLGTRPYGYVSFGYELTAHLNFGRDNVVALRTDTSKEPASRWYTGAGIYRHVCLIIKDAVHIPQWGTFVSTPQVNDKEAVVKVTTGVMNQSAISKNVSLQVDLIDPNGKLIASQENEPVSLAPKETTNFEIELRIKGPQLWEAG